MILWFQRQNFLCATVRANLPVGTGEIGVISTLVKLTDICWFWFAIGVSF